MLKLSLTSSKVSGFRLSIIDIVFLTFAAILTYVAYPFMDVFTWIIPFVVVHFFLFCNVFRVHRNSEILWAIVFCANVIVHFHIFTFQWLTVLMIQIPITIIIILRQIFFLHYRGIFSQYKKNTK
ncbi:hypothetical protein [Candidatus Uabimicrobium sp. HlEnr_7]|uniref:hypothetical protein n=1 Tax=Candidatus Uabimicrobium helgolandensis TaxID=3095367 RepID=UPI003555E933